MDDPVAMMLVVLFALGLSVIGMFFLWLYEYIRKGDLD